jgi:putative ABC transport system permease protein
VTRWRVALARVREWLGARRVEREMSEELDHHVELLTSDYRRQGLSQDAARAAALRDFGGVDQAKEAVRDRRGFPAIGTFMRDVRYALRLLRKTPGFTTAAVVTLALGLGANAAIFSLVDAVLLRPLPYPEPDRLVSIWEGGPRTRSVVAPANFVDYERRLQSFTTLTAFARINAVLTGRGTPERLFGEEVTPRYIDTLGLYPALGRAFGSDDYATAAARPVIITEALWRDRFERDPLVIGRTLTLDGVRHEIIGVMPPAFQSPTDGRFADQISFLTTVTFPAELLANRDDHEVDAVGRLKPGVSEAAARQELEALAAGIGREYRGGKSTGATLALLGADQARDVRTLLLVLQGGVGFVLLIACVNVASLLVVRSAARRREIAVRVAMGATRSRVMRELLTQSLVLAVLGAGAGLALAFATKSVLVGLAPPSMPHLSTVALDGRVIGFTLALAVLTGFFFGLLPAWQVSKAKPGDVLRASDRGVAGGWALRSRNVLIVLEVAISTVLGAGLMTRSLLTLNRVDLGFNPEPVLAVGLTLPESRYATPVARLQFFEALEPRIAALPGVRSVAFASRFPFRGSWESGLIVQGIGETSAPSKEIKSSAGFQAVSPGFFSTLGIRLVRGRLLDARDRSGAAAVAVVSEEFSRALLGGADPIGRELKRYPAAPSITIVGVVADIRRDNRTAPIMAQVYLPAAQTELYPARLGELAVRADGDPATLGPAIKTAVWDVDPNQPVNNIRTLADTLSLRLADKHFQTFLFLLFAGLALVLALVGMYGVVAYAVSERTAEIGLRMALGAYAGQIVRWMLRKALTLVIAGAAIGLVAGYWLSRNIEALLFEIKPTDPIAYGSTAVMLMLSALLASYVAARRATRIDPATALK